jgi:hypothetical protein
MRGILIALVLALSAGAAAAGNGTIPKGFARTATIAPRSSAPIPVTAKLQPVVGSVQRTSHFANPLTHKAKYQSAVFNPVSGQFGALKFRR